MSEVGSAWVTLVPSTRNFGSTMQRQLGGQVDGVGKSMGSRFGNLFKVGALAAVGGAALAGKFLKGAVGDASDLAEAQSKVGVVFGKSADQIIKASQNSATAMGLTKSAYLGATGSLGNLLVSLDIAPKKAAGLSQQMVKLAGDLASFNNVSPEDALAALQSGLTGETEPLKKFGVNMNDATLKAQALKMGLIASTKEALTPQTKALAAQKLIMEQTKTAQGDFARTSGGLANQQRILSAEFGNLKATIGAALLPVVTGFVTFLTTSALPSLSSLGSGVSGIGSVFTALIATIRPLVGTVLAGLVSFVTTSLIPAMRNLYTAIQPALTEAFNLFKSALSLVVGSLGFLGPALVAVTGFMAQHKTAITALVITVGTAVLAWKAWQIGIAAWTAITKAAAAVQAAYNAVMLANPIGLVIVALVALAAGIIYAYKHSATFRGIVDKVWAALKVAGQWVVDVAQKVGGPLASSLKTGISWVGDMIGKVVAFGKAVVDRVEDIAQFVSGLKEKFGNALDYVKEIPGKIKDALSGLYDAGKHAAGELINGLIASLTAGLQRVKDKVSDIAGAIKGFFPGSPVKEGPLTVWNDGRPGRYLMEMLAKGIDDGRPKIITAAMDAAKALRDTFKSKLDEIRSDFDSLAGTITSGFTGNLFEATTASDFVSNLLDTKSQLKALKAAFKKLVHWGVPAKFLSQMFASGNGALIIDMASGPKSTAFDAFQTFGQVQNLAHGLGTDVARNQYGKQLDRLGQKLDRIEKAISRQGREFGKEINGAAAAGQRGRV